MWPRPVKSVTFAVIYRALAYTTFAKLLGVKSPKTPRSKEIGLYGVPLLMEACIWDSEDVLHSFAGTMSNRLITECGISWARECGGGGVVYNSVYVVIIELLQMLTHRFLHLMLE